MGVIVFDGIVIYFFYFIVELWILVCRGLGRLLLLLFIIVVLCEYIILGWEFL